MKSLVVRWTLRHWPSCSGWRRWPTKNQHHHHHHHQVTNKELRNFKRSLKKVEPREVEGFGFGKLHGN